jgi:putative endonuclease
MFWVYILTNKPGGTLYVGVTNDLVRRVFEHREGSIAGFTKRYGVKMLVYYEQHDTAAAAIQREKNIKGWSREWKIGLIVSINPTWRDLYDEIVLRGWIAGSSPAMTASVPHGERYATPFFQNTRSGVVPEAEPSRARHFPSRQRMPPVAGTASNSTTL